MTELSLTHKAQLLKQSEFFVHPADGYPLLEKHEIFLVLAGIKPVSFVCSSHMIDVPGGRVAKGDDIAAIKEFLESLGLYYKLDCDENFTCAYISLDEKLLEQMSAAHGDHFQVGLLFGYPETAAKAFASGKTLSDEKTDALLDEVGVPRHYVQFKLSKLHARDEIEAVKKWVETLKQYEMLDS